MRRIAVAVQEGDGNRLDLRRAAGLGDGVDVARLQRCDDRTIGIQTLGYLEAPFAGHEGVWRVEVQVVEVRAVAAPDRQHVTEAACGDQRRAHALAFGDRIDDRGAAMHELGDALRADPAQFNGRENAARLVLHRGQVLRHGQAAVGFIPCHEVGEGAAHIRCHADHRP